MADQNGLKCTLLWLQSFAFVRLLGFGTLWLAGVALMV